MPISFGAHPPKDALAWFRAKGVKPGFDYRDVWREEHSSAFTVAKAMEVDVLKDVRAAVDKALAEGKTFAQFSAELGPKLQKAGWWGKKEMVDPLTGEVRAVQLGSPRRLKTIYDTNLRTARAAGQWERIQRTQATHPYLLYELGPAEHHREEHVAWAGTLLPVDDSWWRTHYPPNGWGCKCRVRQVSRHEYERLGKQGGIKTAAPPSRDRAWKNTRTGETLGVPEGIDPGWDYNPGMVGREAAALSHLSDTLDSAPTDVAKRAVGNLVGGDGFKAWFAAPHGDYPVAMLPAADSELLGAATRVVRFSTASHAKQLAEHPELGIDEYAAIQRVLDEGERIQDSDLSLIHLLEEDGYVTVVKATRTGRALYLTSFRRLSGQQAKRDREILRLRRKDKPRS
ncbi:MAG: phage minor head protein [Desulfovibrionaceae bacterium]